MMDMLIAVGAAVASLFALYAGEPPGHDRTFWLWLASRSLMLMIVSTVLMLVSLWGQRDGRVEAMLVIVFALILVVSGYMRWWEMQPARRNK